MRFERVFLSIIPETVKAKIVLMEKMVLKTCFCFKKLLSSTKFTFKINLKARVKPSLKPNLKSILI